MALPVVEEGKLLSDALGTVKVQVGQMKRHLVRLQLIPQIDAEEVYLCHLGTGRAHGRT